MCFMVQVSYFCTFHVAVHLYAACTNSNSNPQFIKESIEMDPAQFAPLIGDYFNCTCMRVWMGGLVFTIH